MATKMLSSLSVNGSLLHRLESKGFFLAGDVLAHPLFELMEILDMSLFQVRELVNTISKNVVQQYFTASDMRIQSNSGFRGVRLGLPTIDRLLLGGILPGTVTELVGSAGCGKTQLALQLSVHAALPSPFGAGIGVIYMDVEGKFHPQRLLQIAESRGASASQCANMLASVLVHRVSTMQELKERLELLESHLRRERFGLLIVDSIAAAARTDYSSNELTQRQQMLSKTAAILKYLGDTYKMSVVTINQHTRSPGDSTSTSSSESHPALGVLWHHCVTTRLSIWSKSDLSSSSSSSTSSSHILNPPTSSISMSTPVTTPLRRYLSIAKSPSAPETVVQFRIDQFGVVEEEEIVE